jgi:Type VI secretion system/phage-baseplate injector OB domain
MTGDAFFGKFRGTVTDNQDPDGRGRIQALVPALTGREATGWALPCVPAGFFALPEFEQGDPSLPVWTGCWWADAGSITLRTEGGQTIAITGTDVEISNGKGATVVLHGPTVSVNNSALEVT